MTIFLRTHTQQQTVTALASVGILVDRGEGYLEAAPDYAYDPIGTIFKATGDFEQVEIEGEMVDQEVMSKLPGWHANILGPLTDEQRAGLPLIDPPPVTPYRVFA